jgi:hypothetical protein
MRGSSAFLWDRDSDSAVLGGDATTNVGPVHTTTTYSDGFTASPTINDWGADTAFTSSLTDSETIGAGGLSSGGTITGGDRATTTETYSVTEVSITTESLSTGETATAASSNGSTDTSFETRTITDTWSLLEPSTLTATDGQTVTEGSSDIVSAGTTSAACTRPAATDH